MRSATKREIPIDHLPDEIWALDAGCIKLREWVMMSGTCEATWQVSHLTHISCLTNSVGELKWLSKHWGCAKVLSINEAFSSETHKLDQSMGSISDADLAQLQNISELRALSKTS